MAISILLNGTTHDLAITQYSILHQRDTGDYIYFILPMTVAEGTITTTTTVTAKYLTPGNVLYTQLLTAESAVYKDKYYRYPMQINTNFTGVAGLVNLQLSITDTDNTGTFTFSFNTGEVKVPITKTNAAFTAAQDGGAVSNIAGIKLTDTSLSLLNTSGEIVGETIDLGKLTSAVADKGNEEGGLLVVVND